MTKTQRRIARRRSTSAKSLELKQYQQKIMPNKKKDIIPDIDFQDDQDCGIIEDNMKGESQ
tara:strand:+ start:915 stop:1097 length:183 start_codon:yes stop_codon:yes gene_type:complete